MHIVLLILKLWTCEHQADILEEFSIYVLLGEIFIDISCKYIALFEGKQKLMFGIWELDIGDGGAFSYEANDGKSVLAALHMQDTLGIRLANHLFQLTCIHFRENKTKYSEIKIGIYVINYGYRISVLFYSMLTLNHFYLLCYRGIQIWKYILYLFCSFLNNMFYFGQIWQFIFLFDLC